MIYNNINLLPQIKLNSGRNTQQNSSEYHSVAKKKKSKIENFILDKMKKILNKTLRNIISGTKYVVFYAAQREQIFVFQWEQACKTLNADCLGGNHSKSTKITLPEALMAAR